MKESSEALPRHVLLAAVASTPYLVKLAIAEAQDSASKADPSDLSSIEAELGQMQVGGWSKEDQQGRPPYVRRNLLLLYFQLYRLKMPDVKPQPSTRLALRETLEKVSSAGTQPNRTRLQPRCDRTGRAEVRVGELHAPAPEADLQTLESLESETRMEWKEWK